MKANRKIRDDEEGVSTIFTTLLLLAIVIPIIMLILTTFNDIIMKQIEIMETTLQMMDEALLNMQETMGYDIRSGHGFILENFYNKNGTNHTCYLIAHEYEYGNGSYSEYYNAYYPVERLPADFEADNLTVNFKVNIVDTYFDFVFPDVYLVYNSTTDEFLGVVTDPSPYEGDENYTVLSINVSMVEVLEIETRV